MGVVGHVILDNLWLLFLLLMLAHFWQERRYLKKSRNWLQTTGHIVHFHWTKEGHQLWPKIAYTYEVNTQAYVGEALLLESSHTSFSSAYARKVAYRAAMAYERNDPIEVYYNPENPQQAVLDIRLPRKLDFIIGLLVLFIVLHVTVVGYRWLS